MNKTINRAIVFGIATLGAICASHSASAKIVPPGPLLLGTEVQNGSPSQIQYWGSLFPDNNPVWLMQYDEVSKTYFNAVSVNADANGIITGWFNLYCPIENVQTDLYAFASDGTASFVIPAGSYRCNA